MTKAKDESAKTKTIAVSLSPDTVSALKSYADENKRSISNAVDYLVNQALKGVSPSAP
jgi:hypothetical protein